jgi:CRP/FNR family nitrogen fixation transcriptional regulator
MSLPIPEDLMYFSSELSRAANVQVIGPDPDSDLMGQMGVRISYARDEEIYAQEEDADLIYRVVRGAVRTTCLMSDGRRQIGGFYYPGDLFGIEPGQEHLFSAEALSDSVILVLKRSALRDIADGEMDRLLWGAARQELRRAHEHVMLLGRKTACEKVATLLMNVADRSPGERGALAMTRQDMADYLGLTIETVSRMLSQLQATAVIAFGGLRDFEVTNRQALARLAE